MVKTLFSEWRKNNPDPATTENGKEASMYNPRFEKEEFKKEVINNVKTLFRRTVEEASPQQLFQAVSYAVKEAIIDDWIATQKQMDKDDPKMVYYMSMEFLLGRALGNNLINMTAYKEVKEALDEMGIDLNAIEDQERPQCHRGRGAGSGSRKRRPWPSGSLLPGLSGDAGLRGIRLRHPLPLRHVQAEDRERLSGGDPGQLAQRRQSL